MQQSSLKCIKVVGGALECPSCKGISIKHGKTKTGIQRYKCKKCHRTFMDNYTNQAYDLQTNTWITKLVKEGNGIRGIARLLHISPTTVLKRIIKIAGSTQDPILVLQKQYEVDEICTFCKSKLAVDNICVAKR